MSEAGQNSPTLLTVSVKRPEEVHLSWEEWVSVCCMLEVGMNSAANEGEEFYWAGRRGGIKNCCLITAGVLGKVMEVTEDGTGKRRDFMIHQLNTESRLASNL